MRPKRQVRAQWLAIQKHETKPAILCWPVGLSHDVRSCHETREATHPPLPPLGGVGDGIEGSPPLLHEGAVQQRLQRLCPALALRPIMLPAELEWEVHLLWVLLGQGLHNSAAAVPVLDIHTKLLTDLCEWLCASKGHTQKQGQDKTIGAQSLRSD